MNTLPTIALVDDHIIVRQAIKKVLETIGYRIILETSTGYELLEQMTLLPEPPDICIVDVNMPVLDGAATVKKIKERFNQVKVVGMTFGDNNISKMMAAGADHCLPKHISVEELDAVLKMLFAYTH